MPTPPFLHPSPIRYSENCITDFHLSCPKLFLQSIHKMGHWSHMLPIACSSQQLLNPPYSAMSWKQGTQHKHSGLSLQMIQGMAQEVGEGEERGDSIPSLKNEPLPVLPSWYRWVPPKRIFLTQPSPFLSGTSTSTFASLWLIWC